MRLLSYIMMFFAVGVLGLDGYQICKTCNRSYVMARVNDLNKNSYNPSGGGVSYLPEEDYVEKIEGKENEQQLLDRDNRNLMPEYRGLCEFVTKRVQLDDSEYEFQPPHYHEIYCKNVSPFDNNQRSMNPSKQKCMNSVFHCVQKSKILFFVRRRWDSECWEPYVKEVASGCDCMRPVSDLGDITSYY